jgi:hypothetical protein
LTPLILFLKNEIMPKALYKVIFEGNILPENKPATVLNNIADLFKWKKTRVEQLFQEAPIIIKSGIVFDEAVKYEKAITAAGAHCRIIKINSKSAKPPEKNDPNVNQLKPPSNRNQISNPLRSVPFSSALKGIFIRIKQQLKKTYKIADSVIQTGLILIFTFILYSPVLYIAKGFWMLYSSTPMGKNYLEKFMGNSILISTLFEKDLFFFSGEIILKSFIICMAVSMVCQFLHISRYFYEPRGVMGKFCFWGLLLTAAVSFYIQYGDNEIHQFLVAYLIALIPTLMIFSFCFNLSGIILPELGDIYGRTLYITNKIVIKWLPKVKRSLSKLADRIGSGT